MPDHESAEAARRQRVLIVVAVVCVALIAVLYVLAVHTAWGQRIDETAVTHHRYDRTRPRDIHRYDAGAVAGLSLVGLVVLGLGWGRWRLLATLGGAIAVAVGTADLLRQVILSRPNLGVFDMLYGPSFPSGHATAAVTVAASLLIVSPWPAWVRRAAALAVAAAVDGIVIFIPIHRPSDVIAGNLLGLAFVCVALLAVRPSVPGVVDPGERRWLPWVHFGAAALVEFGVMFLVMSRLAHRSNLSIRAYGAGFAVGLLVDVLSAAAVLATLESVATGRRAGFRIPSSAGVP